MRIVKERQDLARGEIHLDAVVHRNVSKQELAEESVSLRLCNMQRSI